MRAWLSRSRRLGGGERLLEGGELAAHGGDLLVQELDLGQGAGGRLLLGLELRAELARPALAPRLPGFEQALQAAALVLGGAQGRLQGRQVLLDRAPARALEGEEVGQLGDLAVEPVEDGVLGR